MKIHLISVLTLLVFFVVVGHAIPQPDDDLAVFQERNADVTGDNELELSHTSDETALDDVAVDDPESEEPTSDGPDLEFEKDAFLNTTLPLADDDNTFDPQKLSERGELCQGYCVVNNQNCVAYCGMQRYRKKKCNTKTPHSPVGFWITAISTDTTPNHRVLLLLIMCGHSRNDSQPPSGNKFAWIKQHCPAVIAHMITRFHKSRNSDMANSSLETVIADGHFTSLDDVTVMELVHKQFKAELEGLKGVDPNIEGGGAPTKGALTRQQPAGGPEQQTLTPSQYLYNEDFSEVNRTLTNILAAKWLLADEYESFTAHQPDPVKLSRDTFGDFRQMAEKTLKCPDNLMALIVSLILGDQGKNQALVKRVLDREGPRRDEEVNHDEILGLAIRQGEFSPPLKLLPPTLRNTVVLGVKLGVNLNIPQLTQGENVPGSLKGITIFKDDELAFNLKYLEIMFDVAGAGGHVDSRGAIRMIQPVCQSLLLTYPILLRIIAGELSLRGAYDEVLRNRGRILSSTGFRELSTNVPAERALLRLCAMGRVADLSLAQLFDGAFRNLPSATREDLVNGLSVDGVDDGQAVILYYMPALFAELLRVTKNTPKTSQVEAIQCLLSFMARTYNGSKPHKGEVGSIIERDVSPAKDVIVQKGPTALDGYILPART
ncbi:hypothetical protein BO71DRAFT_405607 [Aspergillus ellipticus CBS 707.79]|uniref:Uncharacterized protein n=1 Tax=Aspergillus ellipticus CBS 707.79 TaxID=1448320 RepID=A0A319EE52_9EURO|nr:hypothetical protein BO71DRAFT_405607 [Aspergillus ellipticus CBS 707.79]